MGVRRNLSRGCNVDISLILFKVANDAIQMGLHKTLYPFYTTKKIPHERTRSVRICLESYSGGAVFKFAKGLYLSSFTAFAELHGVSTDIIIIVNCRQLSLNWT